MPSPCNLRCPAFFLPVLVFISLSPFVSPLSFAFAFWPSFSTSLMHSVSQSARLALVRAFSPCLSPPTSKSQPVGERLRATLPPPRGGTGARPCGGRLRGRRHPAPRPSRESPGAPGPLAPPPPPRPRRGWDTALAGAPAPEPRGRGLRKSSRGASTPGYEIALPYWEPASGPLGKGQPSCPAAREMGSWKGQSLGPTSRRSLLPEDAQPRFDALTELKVPARAFYDTLEPPLPTPNSAYQGIQQGFISNENMSVVSE